MKNGLFDIFKEIYDTDHEDQCPTCKCRSNCVDAVFVNKGALKIVQGIAFVDFDNLTNADYRGHILDFDFEGFFWMHLIKR